MAYNWKPSKSARREFAEKMNNDTEFANAYNAKKEAKAEKRRSLSKFDYQSAGGNYIPTKQQHDFCLSNFHLFVTPEQQNAANIVMYGYLYQEKISHDNIHIVNELMRSNCHF